MLKLFDNYLSHQPSPLRLAGQQEWEGCLPGPLDRPSPPSDEGGWRRRAGSRARRVTRV